MIPEYTEVEQPGSVEVGYRTKGAASRDPVKRLGGLVLARQAGESIVIGGSIVLEVLALRTNNARIRVIAPRSVAVHRREVYDAIRLNAPRELTATDEQDRGDSAPDLGQSTLTGGLVLTRRAGETIMIGTDIAVDVVEARPGVVRLRIIAPRSVPVHRREVFDAIALVNQA